MTNTMNSNNTYSIQIDPRWVGLVIGKGGSTLRTLEQQVGGRCSISHDRDKRKTGTFHIQTRNSSLTAKAEELIQQLIRTKTQQQRLRPKVSPILSVSTTQRRKVTLRTNFKVGDSIRDRKLEKWLKHHATDEEKEKHLAKTKLSVEKAVETRTIKFPRLGKGVVREVTGAWGGDLDGVKSEKAVEVEREDDGLEVLVKGEMQKEEEEVVIRPRLVYESLLGEREEDDAFSEDEWDEIDLNTEDEEWSDGELEYGCFDDEEDLAFD